LVQRAIQLLQSLSPAGRTALALGALVACVALLTLASVLVGEGPGSNRTVGSSAPRTAEHGALQGGCTLAREDGTLEQITLRGTLVSSSMCRAFASYLEENVGVEEHTWIARAPAAPIPRANCSSASCDVTPACRAGIASARAPRQPISFVVETEEAFDELHYDTVYAHNVCELLDGRIEVRRFIDHYLARGA
jgi:hypothetical protein